MKKALSVFALSVLMTAGAALGVQAQDVKVYVNDNMLNSGGAYPSAVIINDYTYVPLAEISNALGFECSWVAESKTILMSDGDKQIKMQIGNSTVTIEEYESGVENEIEIPSAPTIVSSKTFVPVRAVADAFNAATSWDGDTKSVYISTFENGGVIGEDGSFSWDLSDAGVLTIKGNGPMPYFDVEAPWAWECKEREGAIHVKIAEGVTSISADAFKGISNLSGVDIPFSVTEIGSNAFNSCYLLKKVSIPYNVSYIGNAAFSNCTSLTDVTISGSGTGVSSDSFSYCVNIKNVNVKK
ncbi:MAG: leucine-rich repeat protein, partial [Firmicutes bacterium]|nr:leucine-rich repeat protein [Bacillota bacterium]